MSRALEDKTFIIKLVIVVIDLNFYDIKEFINNVL